MGATHIMGLLAEKSFPEAGGREEPPEMAAVLPAKRGRSSATLCLMEGLEATARDGVHLTQKTRKGM